METKPRKKRQKKAESKIELEKLVEKTIAAHSGHRAEIRDGIVVIVPELGELDQTDPRNELVGSINDEELLVSQVQGIVTVRKSYDSEIQYVIDDQSQILAQKQAREIRESNQKNQQEASANLKTEKQRETVVVESENYKDIIDIINYQDSGKLSK